MLVSFTQTYGNERTELFDIASKDKKLIELKNLCDVNIYSFHNCDDSVIEKFKEVNKVKNTHIIKYNFPHYTDCIVELKKYLKEIGCTHFLFIQDDVFSDDNDNLDINEMVEYVKEHKENFMLNIRYKQVEYTMKPNEIKKTFKVFHTKTGKLSIELWWGMDDTPFFCTIDMLDEIYDEWYVQMENIWDCEQFLKRKYRNEIINRYITDKSLFKSYNLYGRTLNREKEYRQSLKDKGFIR